MRIDSASDAATRSTDTRWLGANLESALHVSGTCTSGGHYWECSTGAISLSQILTTGVWECVAET